MGRISRYSIPNTYEKEFAIDDNDWRGWEDITQEEIDIAESNGIDNRFLYRRIEIGFMPISRAIKQPRIIKDGKAISKEQAEYLHERGISRIRVYEMMQRGRTFEEVLANLEYRETYRKYKEIAKANGINERTYEYRITAGWDFEKASAKEVKPKTNSQQREYIKQLGISSRTVYYHMNQGKTFDEVVQYVLEKRGIDA